MPEKESKLEKKLAYKRQSGWEIWDQKTKDEALAFSEEYKNFLTLAKTERLAVRKVREMAEQEGFLDWEEYLEKDAHLDPGDKIYAINREKNIALVVWGKQPLTNGTRLILAHIDSPRLDLKITPMYEEENLAFFKTHYYGGIKKYQWPALPLSIFGVVVLKNGKKVEINIGEAPDDPVFMVTDLLPHLAKTQLEKKLAEAIEAEDLNLLIGSIPLVSEKEAKEKVKLNILQILNQKYGIVEEDFVSAEIEVVPAGPAKDLGFDSSMISSYGHDDRVCAYTALKALFEQKMPENTAVVFLTDKEETGSYSSTGMSSIFFYDFVGRLLSLEKGSEEELESDTALRKILRNSWAISADVTAALDPNFKDVYDPRTQARLGFGLAVERYTGRLGKYSTSEAHAEYVAQIRRILDEAEVIWQPAALGKVDIGGGGTVAMFLARYNMEIIDAGVPLFNMHAPFEIASKADVYSAYLGYSAFLASK